MQINTLGDGYTSVPRFPLTPYSFVLAAKAVKSNNILSGNRFCPSRRSFFRILFPDGCQIPRKPSLFCPCSHRSATHDPYRREKYPQSEGGNDVNQFFYVLNMMYSDYYNPSFTDKDYIRIAKRFCHDKDAPADKALKYYRMTNY